MNITKTDLWTNKPKNIVEGLLSEYFGVVDCTLFARQNPYREHHRYILSGKYDNYTSNELQAYLLYKITNIYAKCDLICENLSHFHIREGAGEGCGSVELTFTINIDYKDGKSSLMNYDYCSIAHINGKK